MEPMERGGKSPNSSSVCVSGALSLNRVSNSSSKSCRKEAKADVPGRLPTAKLSHSLALATTCLEKSLPTSILGNPRIRSSTLWSPAEYPRQIVHCSMWLAKAGDDPLSNSPSRWADIFAFASLHLTAYSFQCFSRICRRRVRALKIKDSTLETVTDNTLLISA